MTKSFKAYRDKVSAEKPTDSKAAGDPKKGA
jgi:hypothetical protein